PAAAPARSPPARPVPGPAGRGCARTVPSPRPRPASVRPPRQGSCRIPTGGNRGSAGPRTGHGPGPSLRVVGVPVLAHQLRAPGANVEAADRGGTHRYFDSAHTLQLFDNALGPGLIPHPPEIG